MSLSSRPVIALILLGLSLGACDKQSAQREQANAATSGEVPEGGEATPGGEATSGEVSSGEVASGEATSDGAAAPAAKAYHIDRSKAGAPMPHLAFADAAGKTVTLDSFRGHPVLVNLWATWCAPCVAELPQLDRLAGDYAARGLTVLTVSQDSGAPQTVLSFFKAKGYRHIRPWLDPDNVLGLHYGTNVLPTSLLYDAKGLEVARIVGAPDWTGAETKALLADALKG